MEPDLVKVLVQNHKDSHLKLRLFDAYGRILHEESIAPQQTKASFLKSLKVINEKIYNISGVAF